MISVAQKSNLSELIRDAFKQASRIQPEQETIEIAELTNSVIEQSVRDYRASLPPTGIAAIFYSGPRQSIEIEMHDHVPNNWKRSRDFVRETNAIHIENMPLSRIGIMIFGNEFWFSMRKGRLTFVEKSPAIKKAARSARALLGGAASRQFANKPFNHIYTAVCGANTERVFVRDELPGLLKNKVVETINDIDKNIVKSIDEKVTRYEAFSLVCLGELRLAFAKARDLQDQAGSAWDDYYQRLLSFASERKKALASGEAVLTLDQIKIRQDIYESCNVPFKI